ncbi:MAG: hypothetical protein D6729_09270 [Deltaproteobacteria bacterium]|nr:MAG: hypothetical protein D6729_09270 [Deltaproteobacteria bacterium]
MGLRHVPSHLCCAGLLLAWAACARPSPPAAAPGTDPPEPQPVHDFVRCARLGEVEVSGRYDISGLTEASGVATSALEPGVLWIHNDSGNPPDLFAVTEDGRRLGRIELTGVTNVDWEDIASGVCPKDVKGRRCLYVGDIGDNDARRPQVAVHVLPEPRVRGPFPPRKVAAARTISFTWPGGPRDAEALAVAEDGTVVLVTKGREGYVEVFTLDLVEATPRPVSRARLDPPLFGGAGAATDWVTAADLHPEGFLLLRTYTALWEFDVRDGIDASLPTRPHERLPARFEPQGEAVAYRPEGGYVTVSESSGEIARVTCR